MQTYRPFKATLAAAAIAWLGCHTAHAAPLQVMFFGHGSAVPTGNIILLDGVPAFEITAINTTYFLETVAEGLLPGAWILQSTFGVTGFPNPQPGDRSGGSGTFTNGTGGDAITFTFQGLNTDDPTAPFDGDWDYRLTYTVTGGTGRFADARGVGTEDIEINQTFFTFQTAGVATFDLTFGNDVPEPGSAVLAGLGLLGLWRSRRRWQPHPTPPDTVAGRGAHAGTGLQAR